MPDWQALFDFRGKGRATSHPQTHAPHRTLPGTDQGAPILGPDPVPPSPPPAADKPKINPALRTHVPHRTRHRTHRIPPATNQEVLILSPDPVPPPPPPAADKPKPNSAVGALPATNRQALNAHSTTPKVSTSVVNGLKVALRLLKEAVTGIQVPGLEAAVSGVVKVIDIIESIRSNDRDLDDLSRRISTVADAVGKSTKFHPNEEVSEALRLRMEAFLNELEFMLLKVNVILSDRNLLSRTANSQSYGKAMTDVNTRMDRLISQFSAEGIISLELNMAGARRDVRAIRRQADNIRSNVDVVRRGIDGVRTNVGGINQRLYGVGKKVIGVDQKVDGVQEAQIIQEYEALIKAVLRVHARYNDTSTKPSRPCHPETRIELLKGINKWIKYGPGNAPYLWLCGEVGVGKTTVAHTIAMQQEGLKQLGASFFFSRHDRDRQAPSLLFPSIAYQLARFHRGIWRALAEVLKPDPDIVNRGLTEQFTKLILEPLSRSRMAPSRTVVIVIDGLDECSDPVPVLDALALGVEYVSVRLRILVSSRPYAVIQSKFKNTPLYHLASHHHFHDINPGTLSNDVAAYLTWALREIASRPANRNLPSPWPTAEQLKELISRASGLFIVASTYTKYIDDDFEDNPAAQLNRILSRSRLIGSSPSAELDALYDQVLDDLRRSLKTAHQLRVARDIIEIVILAQFEMSLAACSGLMHMEPSDVRSVLRCLTAVILLPEDEDAAITPFHASFGEYIQDDARCTIRELAVDTMSAHDRIAGRCIAIMASAARDGIIGVEYPEPGDVPRHLSYATQSLADHVRISSHKPAGGDGEIFMQSGIWTWLNLMLRPTRWEGSHFDLGNTKSTGVDVKKAGLTSLLDVGGLHANTTTSVRRLLTAKHVLAIDRTSEIRRRLAMSATASSSTHQWKGGQIITFSWDAGTATDYALRDSDVLRIAAGARRWNMHNYTNFFIESVTFDLHSQGRAKVSSPHNLRGFCNVAQYLERTANLDTMSRVNLALEVAKEVRYIHETSPLHCHGRLVLEAVLVSVEGKPFFGPPEWVVPTSLAYSRGRNPFYIPSRSDPVYDFGYYWPEPGDSRSMLRSLRVRQTADIWDFGCMLFEIMTTYNPLGHYETLAKSRPALGYDCWDLYFWYGDRGAQVYQARYETAISLLLDTFEGPEEVKALLKGCWAIEHQDRPSIQAVLEQLELALEAIGRAVEET